jgi:Cdc6-like AAA superfamily ATPase
MDRPFVYDRYVTGKSFVGRKTDCVILGNLLSAGEHVVMYEPPKSGKMSVIQQTLYNMRAAGRQFSVIRVNMFNVRTIEQFLVRFGSSVIRPVYSTADEYASVVERHLGGTHFVFDRDAFATSDEVVSMNWSVDVADMEAMMRLPFRIAEEKGQSFFVILEEFQNLMMDKNHEDMFKALERVFAENNRAATFVITGSQVNAMKYIFAEKKFFYRQIEHLPLQKVDNMEISEHIVKGFMVSGKVLDRELAKGAVELFRGQMWYLNHFTSICDNLTRGYINEGILMEALKILISIHEPRFMAIVNDLTDHQLSLLRAVLDGVVKFSASEVIEKYALNSSANVRRVKDALKKKEVLTFNEKDEPLILDPLFEYWVSKKYFEI